MNADGKPERRLTRNRTDDLMPAWSPDGVRLAFTRGVEAKSEIYTMNPDGSGQTRLTHNRTADLAPAWKPLQRK